MIAVDCETCDPEMRERGSGAHRGSFIAGVAVGTEAGFRQYYPVAHEGGGNVDPKRVFAWLKQQMKLPVPKVFAHALYDIGFLSAAGIEVAGPYYDVQVAEPLLDENRFTYSLEALAQDYLGEGKRDEELDELLISLYGRKNPKGNIWRLPGDKVTKYAIGDVDLPLRIFAIQKKELEKQDLWSLFTLETKLIPMLLAMRQRGVRVDLKKAEVMLTRLRKRQAEVEGEIKRASGVEVAIWAADSIGRAFDSLGLKYPRTPKTNKPSFKGPWLEEHPHPVAGLIREARKIDKLCGTFLEGSILEKHHQGRIHCNFNQLKSDDGGAVSGRFSSSQPNLQFIPIRTEEGKLIRTIFLPDEGQDWWKKDYCVHPDSRILTTDLQHIKASEVRPGMELVGFDEGSTRKLNGRRGSQNPRKLRRTHVVSVKRLIQPCYRVKTTNGSFTTSSEHRWLAASGNGVYSWVATNKLKIGMKIPRLCRVWDFDDSHESGWVSGFLDGEGSYNRFGVKVGQLEGPVAQRFRSWCSSKGYQCLESHKPNGLVVFSPLGGRSTSWEIIGSTRPVRLIPKIRATAIDGVAYRSKTGSADTIVSIKSVGEQEVIAIETEHKTLIVNGLLSHNSQVEFRLIAHDAASLKLRGAQQIVDEYNSNSDADFHQVVGEMAGIGRVPAKTVNFGLAYGEGLAKLCVQLGLSKEDGEALLKRYHRFVPFMRPLAQGLSGEAARKGELRTMLNRKRRFNLWAKKNWKTGETAILRHRIPGSTRAFTHKALNARIQGSAADVMKRAMVDVWESGACEVLGPPQLTVHDELDGSSPKTKAAREALAEVSHLMEGCVKLLVKLKVDSSTGPNWGDQEDTVAPKKKKKKRRAA